MSTMIIGNGSYAIPVLQTAVSPHRREQTNPYSSANRGFLIGLATGLREPFSLLPLTGIRSFRRPLVFPRGGDAATLTIGGRNRRDITWWTTPSQFRTS